MARRGDLGQPADALDLPHGRFASFAVVSSESAEHRAGPPGHDGHAPCADVTQRRGSRDWRGQAWYRRLVAASRAADLKFSEQGAG